MRAEGPKHYNRTHRVLFNRRNSSHKLNWDDCLDLAREVSKYLVGSVLDLGCGLGFLAKFAPGHYLGVDFSAYSVHTAKKMNWSPAARFVQGDIRNLPDVGPFDTVTMLEVLEHLEDRAGAIEAAKKLAVKRMVISVPNGRSRSHDHIWNDIRRGDVVALMGAGTTCHAYRRKWIAVWERKP